MLEHTTLYIYLWSIYSNITITISIICIIAGIIAVAFLIPYFVEDNKLPELRKGSYIFTSIFVVTLLITILTPKKHDLLLILAADPIVSAAIDSYHNGKLKKVDQLIDLSLDKALKALKE